MKHKRLLFRLVPSTHGIEGIESASWPTLTANGFGSHGHQKMMQHLVDLGYLTQEERRGMICGNGGLINPIWAEWFQGYVKEWSGLIPTPRASEWKGAAHTRYVGGGSIQAQPLRTDRGYPGRDYWQNEPDVDRVAYGIPNRVDRIRCLGNAVVPQQFYPIFKAIAEIEKGVTG